MSNKKLLSVLIETNKRLDTIEFILRQNADKLNLIGLEEPYNLNDFLDENYPDDEEEVKKIKNDDEYYSDSDCGELILEESYDSENEYAYDKPEVYPEPKLTLTLLQLQLADAEFMKYKIAGEYGEDIDSDDDD
jgi:hypothetical protein